MYTVWFSCCPLYHLPANTPGIKMLFNQLQYLALSWIYHGEKRKRKWNGEYMDVIKLAWGPYWGNNCRVSKHCRRLGSFSGCVRLTLLQNKNISINSGLFRCSVCEESSRGFLGVSWGIELFTVLSEWRSPYFTRDASMNRHMAVMNKRPLFKYRR